MAYLALYRKYRPSTFDEIVGQKAVVTALRNQVKFGTVGHAYLFCGTRGTGKTSVARVFAKAVNCLDPKEGSPCNECELCREAASGFNIIEIDAASNNGVDNIRELRDEVVYTPVKGRYKVYIIDEVHMLSPSAFNALLKTLEEPPEHVIFILATTEPQKVMATILSRCQRYDFKRLTVEEIRSRLAYVCREEGIEAESDALAYMASYADGGMRDALSLLDQCRAYYTGEAITLEKVLDVLGAVDGTVLADMTASLARGDALGLLEGVDRIFLAGRDPLQFVLSWTGYLRGVLMYRVLGDEAESYVNEAENVRARMKEQGSSVTREQLIFFIQELSRLANSLRFAQQRRILLETGLISIASGLSSAEGSSALSARLDLLEQKLESLKAMPAQASVAAQSAAPAQARAAVSSASGTQSSGQASAPRFSAEPAAVPAEAPSAAKAHPGEAKASDKPEQALSGDLSWGAVKDRISQNYPPLSGFLSDMTLEEGEEAGTLVLRGEPFMMSFVRGKEDANLRWMEQFIQKETGKSYRILTGSPVKKEGGKSMQEIVGSMGASIDWK